MAYRPKTTAETKNLDRFRKRMKKLGYIERLVDQTGIIPRHVKKRRGIWGAVYTRSEDERDEAVYVAFRISPELFRNGNGSNSDAIRLKEASWAINYDTLRAVEREGVTDAAIFDASGPELYHTTVKRFLDSSYAPQKDYSGRGGALQRYLPVHLFHKRKTCDL